MTAPQVAVVDDDPVTLEVVAAFLRAEGFEVHTYAGSDEFLASVDMRQPDCLLLDIYMPGCSGLDLLTLIGGRHCGAPVVMMSARGDIPTAMAALEAGAYDFIEKPINSTELLAAIRQAVRDFEERTGGT